MDILNILYKFLICFQDFLNLNNLRLITQPMIALLTNVVTLKMIKTVMNLIKIVQKKPVIQNNFQTRWYSLILSILLLEAATHLTRSRNWKYVPFHVYGETHQIPVKDTCTPRQLTL